MTEALVCIASLLLLGIREWMNARERRDLYQRIQAPELAVARHERAEEPKRTPLPVLRLEDDEALARLREERERGGA